jgi:hypothetical protein
MTHVPVLSQLRGRKRVRLIAESQLPHIYPYDNDHLLARRYGRREPHPQQRTGFSPARGQLPDSVVSIWKLPLLHVLLSRAQCTGLQLFAQDPADHSGCDSARLTEIASICNQPCRPLVPAEHWKCLTCRC